MDRGQGFLDSRCNPVYLKHTWGSKQTKLGQVNMCFLAQQLDHFWMTATIRKFGSPLSLLVHQGTPPAYTSSLYQQGLSWGYTPYFYDF